MRALTRGGGGGIYSPDPLTNFDFGQVYSNGASLNQLLDTKHS